MNKPPTLDLDDIESLPDLEESSELGKRDAPTEAPLPRAKKQVSEKTLAALAEGRKKRDEGRAKRKAEQTEAEKLAARQKEEEARLNAEKRAALQRLVDQTVSERLALKAAVENMDRKKRKRVVQKAPESESETDDEVQERVERKKESREPRRAEPSARGGAPMGVAGVPPAEKPRIRVI